MDKNKWIDLWRYLDELRNEADEFHFDYPVVKVSLEDLEMLCVAVQFWMENSDVDV